MKYGAKDQRFLTDKLSSARNKHQEESWVSYGKDFEIETSQVHTGKKNKSESIHDPQ